MSKSRNAEVLAFANDMIRDHEAVNAQALDLRKKLNVILAHRATVRGGFDVMIPAKQTASMVIPAAGGTDYYCRFHPNMKGRIVVPLSFSR